ncbi:MAG: hypothetical protein ACRDYU_03755 [Actinomycetes bacterium]
MSLPWVRLDAAFPGNRKVLSLTRQKEGHRAVAVFVFSLAYAGQQGSDGHVPAYALGIIHGRGSDADRLVDAGLWHDAGHDCKRCPQPDSGSYVIHDWPEYQPTAATRAGLSERGRRAANARWHRNGTGDAHA